MSIKFSALEIGSGDAFLLDDNGWKCLYDAGGSKSRIINLLKNKNIKHLNLAICSHNDVDHANGFIGLLDSDIELDEIWLPGTWASILKFFNEELTGYHFHDLERSYCDFCNERNKLERPLIDGLFDNSGEQSEFFAEDFYDELSDIYELHECFSNHIFWYRYQPNTELEIAFDRIIKIASKAYKNGCKIRWFNPFLHSGNSKIDYNFYPLNSREIHILPKIKNAISFFYALSLSVENKYSLIFEYFRGDTPIIRFSADSDSSDQSIDPYVDNILVTAPHHGSDSNSCVYANLKGNKIIWVRSDGRSKKRPCPAFKLLANRYCLACYNRQGRSEIRFEYKTNTKTWKHISGIACTC